jgi:hypothetical protein
MIPQMFDPAYVGCAVRASTLHKNQPSLQGNNYNTPPDSHPLKIDMDCTHQSADIQPTLMFI